MAWRSTEYFPSPSVVVPHQDPDAGAAVIRGFSVSSRPEE